MFPRRALTEVHSTALLLLLVLLAFWALAFSDPVFVVALWLMLTSLLLSYGAAESWRRVLGWSLAMGGVLTLVNILASKAGATVLWESLPLPLFGRIRLTAEVLLFSAVVSVKLSSTLLVCALYGRLLPLDRSFSLYSRVAPQSALLAVMSCLFIPRLERRIRDSLFVLRIRGARLDGSYLERCRAYYQVFKVLLASSLEDGWQLAEALFSRAYGTGARSRFAVERFGVSDKLWLLLFGGLLAGSVASLFEGTGSAAFYPTYRAARSLPFVALLFSGMLAALFFGLSLGAAASTLEERR